MNLEKYLMINYSEENKVYHLFDLVMRKYYIRRNVIFNEKFKCER